MHKSAKIGGAFLLLVACLFASSMPVSGVCTLVDGPVKVEIAGSLKCPITQDKPNQEGWERVQINNYNYTMVKLQSGPNIDVDKINWNESATAFMKKEKGIPQKPVRVIVSGKPGIEVSAEFPGGTGRIIDIPLKDNRLFEVLSRSDSELAEILTNTTIIEE